MSLQCPKLRFGIDEAIAANAWQFNCGPGALCAVLGMTPDEIRPHLLGFEQKGYTNPSLMAAILHGMGIRFRRVYECAEKLDNREPDYPAFGLCRFQWGGPWCRPEVNIKARYRFSHWVGIRHGEDGREVFDVNNITWGGWLSWKEWSEGLVPWLLKEAVPRADGSFWPTHCWEIESTFSTGESHDEVTK